ncbi:matrix metalloproteinase-16 isoform X2 [Myotis daubentonii]|uniref:matrix metalloproteinase-16 isoform X2 n=1 Tax=Myotis daubentonii TaxID=98922 RepID=UPI002873D162|nr:matrix metalloproteinase-16 isoform X2 [Myotis daubentonii]
MILLALGAGRRLDVLHPSGTVFLQTLLWIVCAAVCGAEQYFNVEVWLQKYGYLPPTEPRLAVLRSAEAMQSALAAMQQFYGINMTGKVDRNTIDWMKRPRCGVPDQTRGGSRFSVRRKRYALTGQKWQHKHITYSIKNVTPKVGDPETRRAIRRAFDVWQNVTPLTFEEVPYSELENGKRDVDITIIFASGFHGDSSPFDGEGGFLAHAYFPGPGIGGDTHFDSDEPWTLGNPNHDGPPDKTPPPTRPLPTAPPHRSVPPADPRRNDRPKPPRPPTGRPAYPGAKPSICEGNFNTLAILRREMFVFKDQWFWRVRNNRVMDGYPMQITYFWRGLPPGIDAVYENNEGNFVFFKGNKYWVFKDTTLQPGYPHDLVSLGSGIPPHGIDSAIWWEDVGKTYFFKGNRYWRYSEEMKTMDPGYPKPITVWKGIPDSPQGAFVHKENGFTYFYKGKEYWKFNNQILKVEPGYPRSILKDFMGCDGPTDRHTEGHSPPDDVDIVIKLDNTAGTVRAVAIVIPCILALCLLALAYTVLQFKRKGTPRHILYCKRSMQEWV